MARRSLGFRVTVSNSPHDRAVLGALAMHSKYSQGKETSAQISAQEANLEYANVARLNASSSSTTSKSTRVRGTKSHPLPKTGHYQKPTSRGKAYGRRFQDGAYLAGLRPLPRGARFVAYDAKKAPKAAAVTGKFKKFMADVGPGHFDARTSWSKAHKSSGFTKIVTPRKKRLAHQKNWSHRGHMWIPK
jgi:ribosomal protein L24